MFGRTRYAKSVANERPVSPFIPQRAHLSSDTIITKDGDLHRTWKIQGTSFETADMETVHMLKEQLNTLIRSCLLYTSPSPRDRTRSRMPSSA